MVRISRNILLKATFFQIKKIAYCFFAFVLLFDLVFPNYSAGQVQLDRFIETDEISLEMIQDRRNELIEAGYLIETAQPDLPYSTGSASLLEHAFYTKKKFQSTAVSPRGTDFRPNGTRLYVLGRSSENIIEYHLSEPWDITTAQYQRELDTSDVMDSQTQSLNASHGIHIRKSDGLKLYVVNRTEIWEYTLSTAWNIATATQTGYKDLSSWHLRAHGVDFKSDGTVMFMEDRFIGVVFQYNLSTPWDIETATLDYTYDVPVHQDLQGIQLHTNGSRMFLIDNGLREIHEFTISTPLDLRTASYISSFSLSSTPDGIYLTFKPDFKAFFISDPETDIIHEYEIILPPDPNLSTITALSSKVQANNLNTGSVRVVVIDENGDPIQDASTRLISKTGRLDHSPSSVNTNSDGEAFFEVKNNRVETVVYSAISLNVELDNTASVNFIGIDPDLSSISESESRIQANHNQHSIITVLARDEDGDPFTNLNINLLTESGNATVEVIQGKTDSNGEAIFRVSRKDPSSVTLRARGLGTTLSDAVKVDFLGVDPELSSITASKSTVEANDRDYAEIKVVVRDEDDTPFGNIKMQLIPDNGLSSIENIQQVTDSDGIAIFRVSNETIESVDYRARGLSTTISGTVTINYIPVAPVALSASDVETRSLIANWEVVEGADQYFFDLSTDSTFSTFLTDYENLDVGLTTSLTIESAQPGTTYFYRVRAGRDQLVGANSETIQVNTFPDTPVASAATHRNATSFRANWSEADGAQSYRLDVALDPDFQQILSGYDHLNTGNESFHDITGLELGTAYYYRVRSVAGPRTSPQSNVIETSTLDINHELSTIEQEQLRILANGRQTNTITIRLISDEGSPLSGVQTVITPEQGQIQIEATQPVTDDEGVALFELSGVQAGIITFTVSAIGREIGTFDVEFIQDLGQLTLGNNYPNPYQQNTIIPVTIPETMQVEIRVYDRLGRYIRTVINEQMVPGYYEIPFHAHGMASGTYFYRMITSNGVKTEKMVLIR